MDTLEVDNTPVEECGAIGGVPGKSEVTKTENKNSICDFCIFDDTEVKAVAFCMNCSEQLCSNCAREHRKNKSSRHHNLLESEDIINDVPVIKALKKMMTCPDHPDITVTYKCEDHDRYICVSCLAEYHRKCNDVNEISKANTRGKDDVYENVKEALSQLQEVTIASKMISEENIAGLRDQQVAIELEQQSLFRSLHEKLSQVESNIETERRRLVTEELQYSEGALQKCKEAEDEEKECTKVFESILKFEISKETNIIPDLIFKKAKRLSEEVKKASVKSRKTLKFERKIDVETMSTFAKLSIVSEGQDEQVELSGNLCVASDEIPGADSSIKPFPTSIIRDSPIQYCVSTQTEIVPQSDHTNICNDTYKSSTQELDNNSEYVNLITRNINHQGIAYKARCPGDHLQCNIYASEILSDERVVLIDYSNKKLKVFNDDFSLGYQIKLGFQPMDICHVQDTTFAIAFDDDRSIEMYKIGKENGLRTGSFQTKCDVIAIENFGNDGNIVVLFEDTEKKEDDCFFIQIRCTKTGRIDESFWFDKSPKVPFRFQRDETKRILCNGEDEIIVSDGCKLHCFSTVGVENSAMQESWYYKSCAGRITDLADDSDGNMYVCGYYSHNVQQISKDNYRVKRILVNHIRKPLSISVNSRKRFLVIGCSDDDFVRVYHFL